MRSYRVLVVVPFLLCTFLAAIASAYVPGRDGPWSQSEYRQYCRGNKSVSQSYRRQYEQRNPSRYYSPVPTAPYSRPITSPAPTSRHQLASIPALIQAVKDPDSWVRADSVQALGSIGPAAQAALPVLVESLKDPAVWVRARAARALGRLGPPPPATVAALAKALQDEESSVRFAAVEALGSLGPAAKDAIPALERTTQDANSVVRRGAEVALKKIRP
jgi:hypothetical protein